jgi:hypothetical protein
MLVLLFMNLFAGRDDFSAPKSEGRKSLAQCVSTGNLRTTRVSPGTGRKDSGPRASYAPFRGCLIGHRTHGCAPWAIVFRPSGFVRSTRFAACRNVLLSTNLFAGRDDFFAPKSEGRKRIAQCASTGNLRTTRVSPGTGRKDSGPRASYAPFRGCLIGHRTHGSAPWAIIFRPSGFVRSTRFAARRNVGQVGNSWQPAAGW